ncbi:hypothetical protein P3T36_004630 [Kitasatospora sp. MAP12-15]|uniref:hypothetical protein n=1 Tax=unclassified Kitasatospora TaxID=2633591 RepID=UPI00247496C7|nr:hypothetical protein [Kitasatospora sp. MAP12-44]MDH6111476.1 hypothetical protein [Kitasatospora sp. MAP12-44]
MAWRLAGTRVCLSWKQRSVAADDGAPAGGDAVDQVVFHEGSTRGFVAFAGFDPVARTRARSRRHTRGRPRTARGRPPA